MDSMRWMAAATLAAALAAGLGAPHRSDGAEEDQVTVLRARVRALERQHALDLERIRELEAQVARLKVQLAGGSEAAGGAGAAEQPEPAEKEAPGEAAQSRRPLSRRKLVAAVRQAYTFEADATSLERTRRIEALREGLAGKRVRLHLVVEDVAADGTARLRYRSGRTVMVEVGRAMAGGAVSVSRAERPLERIDVQMPLKEGAAGRFGRGERTTVTGRIVSLQVKQGGGGRPQGPVHIVLVLAR